MQDDPLFGLLIGCECRRKCQEEAGPPPAPPTPLFQAAPRTRLPLPALADEPFILPIPAWDTPQRPTPENLPRTDGKGTFLSDRPVGDAPVEGPGGLITLDSGAQVALPAASSIDHLARTVTGRSYSDVIEPGYSPDAVVFEPLGRALERAAQPESPYKVRTLAEPHTDTAIWLNNIVQDRSGGQMTTTVRQIVQRFEGQRTEDVLEEIKVTGTIWTAKTELRTPNKAYAALEYKFINEWVEKPTTDPNLSDDQKPVQREQRLMALYHSSEKTPDENFWFTDQWIQVAPGIISQEVKTRGQWKAEGWDGVSLTTESKFTGPLEYQKFPQATAHPVPPDGVRFRATGVTVTGAARDNPADLTGGTLSAYGHSLSGGSWAALRDNPVQKPDGTWDFSPLIVLHESGDTVTAVRADGSRETCTRAVFEREVLRVPVGSFQRFLASGHAYHSWPNQWCWAAAGTEARALVAFDPWRDCTKRRQPNTPESWTWAARPPRRPKRVPGTPRCPLNVALAMVGTAGDEPLAKGRGPLLLPTKAEVPTQGAWGVSEKALAALAKRVLYQPAGWPEELDDSKAVRGEMRVSFSEALDRAVLLIRGRALDGKPFAVKVNGDDAVLHKLGHNSPEKRGWHPYLLEVTTPNKELLLSSNGEITRCLRLNQAKVQQE